MKKILATILSLTLALCLLAGCTGRVVVLYTPEDTTAPGETQPPVIAEGAVKTGLAVVAKASGSNASSDADGKIEYDVTLVAVLVDNEGVIADCVIDSIGASVNFDAAGQVKTDVTATVSTKNELGDSYGMVAWGGAVAEWYQQADALANYAVGKTVEQLKNGAINESGYAADADLATSATIYLGGYVSAIEAAVNNAKHLGAQAGDELRLASVNSIGSTVGAEGENNGTAQLDSDVTALTVKDGVITSCVIDSLQGKVNFSAVGEITSDLSAPLQTKTELGDSYGMVAWAGATAEWYQQAASFAAYVTGKTVPEVNGIAVDEGTKPTDADLSTSVTIAIGGFQKLITKAAQ